MLERTPRVEVLGVKPSILDPVLLHDLVRFPELLPPEFRKVRLLPLLSVAKEGSEGPVRHEQRLLLLPSMSGSPFRIILRDLRQALHLIGGRWNLPRRPVAVDSILQSGVAQLPILLQDREHPPALGCGRLQLVSASQMHVVIMFDRMRGINHLYGKPILFHAGRRIVKRDFLPT